MLAVAAFDELIGALFKGFLILLEQGLEFRVLFFYDRRFRHQLALILGCVTNSLSSRIGESVGFDFL